MWLVLVFGGDTSAVSDGSAASDALFALPWPPSATNSGGATNTTWAPQVWANPVPPLAPAPRYAHAMVHARHSLPHHILVFGGRDAQSTFASLWLLDLRTTQWAGIGPPPVPPAGPTAPKYAPGAYRSQVDSPAPASLVSLQTDGLGCPWPAGRAWPMVEVVDDLLVLMMGWTRDSAGAVWTLGDVWVTPLNASIEAAARMQNATITGEYVWTRSRVCPLNWTQITQSQASANLTGSTSDDFPSSRYSAATAVRGTDVWLMGGIAQNAQLSDIWILHLYGGPADTGAGTAAWWEGISWTSPASGPSPVARYDAGLLPLLPPFQMVLQAQPEWIAGNVPLFIITGGRFLNAPTDDRTLHGGMHRGAR
jgi:hypothetical protein